MRFTSFVASLFVAATAVSALPAGELKREAGDLQTIGKGLCFLEAGLGVTSLEEFLDTTLGGAVTALEKKLGVTDLEKSLDLTSCNAKGLSDIEAIGTGLCYVEKGLGVTATEDELNSILGGALTGLEDILGVTALEKKLKLTGC